MLDDILGIHEQALQLRARRSEVLAANLANADTPGYKSRDFDFKEILKQQTPSAVRLATTSRRHLSTDLDSVVPAVAMRYRIPQQPSVDGNTVEVEREQVEFGANAMRYQASLRFLDGKIKGLLTAITGRT